MIGLYNGHILCASEPAQVNTEANMHCFIKQNCLETHAELYLPRIALMALQHATAIPLS